MHSEKMVMRFLTISVRAYRAVGTAAAVLLLLLCGCNTALVDGTYHGEPLLTLQGQVQIIPAMGGQGDKGGKPGPGDGGGQSGDGKQPPKDPAHQPVQLPEGQLRLAIVWESTGVDSETGLTMSTFEQSVELTASFPAGYVMTLFSPPPESVVHTTKAGSAYALGSIVAYADADNSGSFDPTVDSLIGGATGRALLWAEQDMNATWLRKAVTAGYHRLRIRPDKKTCDSVGHAQFELDKAEATNLQVFEVFPKDAMVDLNCDGKRDEWRGACPPKEHLKQKCKGGDGDQKACDYCLF